MASFISSQSQCVPLSPSSLVCVLVDALLLSFPCPSRHSRCWPAVHMCLYVSRLRLSVPAVSHLTFLNISFYFSDDIPTSQTLSWPHHAHQTNYFTWPGRHLHGKLKSDDSIEA